MLTRPETLSRAAPPPIASERYSLFIDFDGTLVALIDRPDQVRADAELIDLLGALHVRFGRRLALVSGRSVEQLDAIVGPLASKITLAGSHGAEIRVDGELRQSSRPMGLDPAIADVHRFADLHSDLLVEIKSQGVAMHYRMAPELEMAARQAAAAIAIEHGLELQPGKMMIELRGFGTDKGEAVATLMRTRDFAGSLPVMIGDDLTDEPALAVAAELGGFGILVGEPRVSAALYGLPDVGDVRRWLAEAAR